MGEKGGPHLSGKVGRSAFCVLVAIVVSSVLLTGGGRAPSIDPYEVPPGNPVWFPLEDFESKGEVLHYTITFKKSQSEGEVQRPIDFILIDQTIADQNPPIEIALQYGLHKKINISERSVGEFKNDRDGQIMALFYNHQREGDTKDWDNASVNIRFDYYLSGEEVVEPSPWPMVLLVVLIIVVVAVIVVLLIRRLKRGRKDAVTFFNPEEGPYYVVRTLADSKIFYLDPNQYSALYSSGRMGEFEFLGTSPRIGGTIIPPEGQGPMVLEAQALPTIPLQEAFVSDVAYMGTYMGQPNVVGTGWEAPTTEAPSGTGPLEVTSHESTSGPLQETFMSQEALGSSSTTVDEGALEPSPSEASVPPIGIGAQEGGAVDATPEGS